MKQHRIIPENITKFLVQDSDQSYIAYKFARFGIYVDNVRSILTTGRMFQDPAIVIVRYRKYEQLINLINNVDKKLQPKRIFKTLRTKYPDMIDGFIKNCAKNFCGICKGLTIRVVCKEDSELQNKFYSTFKKINTKEKFKCKFDYDSYDVEFVIRKYQKGAVTYIVTWFLTYYKVKKR